MLPPSLRNASSAFKMTIMRPTTRRLFTSSFFLATFCGAIITVSLTTLLPCPARVGPGQYRSRENRIASEEASSIGSNSNLSSSDARLRQGERIHLTKKGGWIEIDEGIATNAAR